jgi:SpoVK/Ycf46/Vps4 family AAA+-type ATPase
MKELDDVVYRADFEKAAGRRSRVRSLNQIIIGPPGTGKKYEANNYAKKLIKAGLIHDECLLFDGNLISDDIITPQHILHIFHQHKNGIVIIDDIYYFTSRLNENISHLIDGIITSIKEDGGPVFVLTGDDKEMERFLNQHPLLKNALPPPVYTKSRLHPEKKNIPLSGPELKK